MALDGKGLVKWKKKSELPAKSAVKDSKGTPDTKVEGSSVRAKQLYRRKVVTRGMPEHGSY